MIGTILLYIFEITAAENILVVAALHHAGAFSLA